MLKQLSIQELTQLQDQNYSNDILLRALSKAESYANIGSERLQNDTRKYGYYDTFGNSKRMAKPEFLKKFLFDLHMFGNSYEDYINKYKKYDYPKGMSENEILKDIEFFKSLVPPEDKVYYNDFCSLIKYHKKPNYRGKIRDINQANAGKIQPMTGQDWINIGPEIRQNIDSISTRVQQDYELGRDARPRPNLFGDYRDDRMNMKIIENYERGRCCCNRCCCNNPESTNHYWQ